MDEIIIKGIVVEDNWNWYFETENEAYTGDILSGLDEILSNYNKSDLMNGDEIELTIKIKRNK